MSKTEKATSTPVSDWNVIRAALPPDPDCQNDRRSFRARNAIAALTRGGGTDVQDALSDLLRCLMHFCDRHPEFGNFEEELDRALQNYGQEIMKEGAFSA